MDVHSKSWVFLDQCNNGWNQRKQNLEGDRVDCPSITLKQDQLDLLLRNISCTSLRPAAIHSGVSQNCCQSRSGAKGNNVAH